MLTLYGTLVIPQFQLVVDERIIKVYRLGIVLGVAIAYSAVPLLFLSSSTPFTTTPIITQEKIGKKIILKLSYLSYTRGWCHDL